ncbi:MAG: hypothetical protein ACI4QA_03835 [Candidatus Spyradosoma sp.]
MNKKTFFLILSIAVATLASACSSVPAGDAGKTASAEAAPAFYVVLAEGAPAFPLRETTRVFYERGNSAARLAALEFRDEAKKRFGIELKAEGLRPHSSLNDNSVIFIADKTPETREFELFATEAHLEISARTAEGFSAGIRKALEK